VELDDLPSRPVPPRRPLETWAPTEEESRAIAEGTLQVIPCIGGPIYIDLRD
jgi:hypothetical protein